MPPFVWYCFESFTFNVATHQHFFLYAFPGYSVRHRRSHNMEKANATTGKGHSFGSFHKEGITLLFAVLLLKFNWKRTVGFNYHLNSSFNHVPWRALQCGGYQDSILWSALLQLQGEESPVQSPTEVPFVLQLQWKYALCGTWLVKDMPAVVENVEKDIESWWSQSSSSNHGHLTISMSP